MLSDFIRLLPFSLIKKSDRLPIFFNHTNSHALTREINLKL
jgi:hypothetical protein